MDNYILCTLHDPSSEAFFIKEGEIKIQSDLFALQSIHVKNLLVGTFEFFVADESGDIPPRILQIEVESNEPPISIPFDTVEEMFHDFKKGHKVNEFLAFLVDYTNQKIRELSSDKNWKQYIECAQFLAEIVEELEEINKHYQLNAISDLIKNLKGLHIIESGLKSRQAISLSGVKTGHEQSPQKILQKKAGELICKDGDDADGLFVLLKGEVTIKKCSLILTTLNKPGESFGELSLFLKSKRTADVYAKTAVTLLQVTKDNLEEFHKEHPSLFYDIARVTTKRIVRNLDELKEMKTILSANINSILSYYCKAILNHVSHLRRSSGIASISELSKKLSDGIDKRLSGL